MTEPAPIPFPVVAQFVRRHTHDLRNELNALDLEATLLSELIPPGEASEALTQLRRQLRSTATQLRELCNRFHEPAPELSQWLARDLFEQCQRVTTPLEPAPGTLQWENELDRQSVMADLDPFADAWCELVRNAFLFREPDAALLARATAEGAWVRFELIEEKAAAPDFAHWGTAPFQTTRRNGYGLGLFHADRQLHAQGAQVERSFQSGHLVTSIQMPLLPAA